MSRAFRISIAPRLKDNNHLVFLGDLFDGGREWFKSKSSESGSGSLDQEPSNAPNYFSDYHRFKKIFPLPSFIDTFYVAGNHDMGIGRQIVSDAVGVWRKLFSSSLDYSVDFTIDLDGGNLAKIEYVVINSLSLATDGGGSHISSHQDTDNGDNGYESLSLQTRQFLDQFAPSSSRTKILFTHVPLHRHPGTHCGSLRMNSKSIERGSGYQYRNMLNLANSQRVLNQIKPNLVFSGDDHDFCLVRHQSVAGPNLHTIPEARVKFLIYPSHPFMIN